MCGSRSLYYYLAVLLIVSVLILISVIILRLLSEMDMEGICTEEHVVKGKRTKRQRPLSPCAVAGMTSSCSSGSGSDQEEEDMAKCLILLARGRDAITSTSTSTNSNNKIGFYIYECKTCNRTFPSFQALGGHRASHKRPKVTQANCEFEEAKQTHPPNPLQLGKIHECSICGSEFTSGQALGGHMRRHRASTNTFCDTAAVQPKPRNLLEFDLNLPAPPEDDVRDSKVQFSMVLSAAPPLVGCHY